jgi:hypothetical protein
MRRRSFLSLGAMTAAATLGPRVASATTKDIKLPSPNTVYVGGSRRIEIEGVQQLRGQQNVSVTAALALANMNDHTFAVDIADPEMA